MINIVIISGLTFDLHESGIGKSTLAGELVKYYHNNGIIARVFSFSEELKALISRMFAISRSDIEVLKNDRTTVFNTDPIIKHFHKDLQLDPKPFMTMREILIYIGTDVIRNKINQNWHVDQTIQKIELSGIDIAIIDDCRIEQEYTAMIDRFEAKNVRLINIYKGWWNDKTIDDLLK